MYHNIPIIMLIARLVFSLICQEVLEMPENKKLNFKELQTMQPKEVADCLTHLGREEMRADEAEFIWNSLIEFFKGIANIPEEVLAVLHYVTVAVQPEDYLNITMANIDVIRNFGLDYGLNDDHLEAIAWRVREDFGGKEPEDYTVYDLEALRQILCAFNRSEIERIRPKAFKEAAGIIGKLRNCNRDIMQGFAQLATQKNAFGSPSLWTNTTLHAVGAVAEYLPSDVVTKLKVRLGRNVFTDENN
ncbi:otoancorin-like [Maniola jurtina]|uniref:otoancorin-like n=1 Tax=Maniola jurtina TaxID=191418 RepID=UPI001E68900B|nr:otoancorin-like [Maniola jurtina]